MYIYVTKCKICVIVIITVIYKIIHLLIKFIISTMEFLESYCIDTSYQYPDHSLNSTQTIPYRSKCILLGETFSRPI